MQQAQAAVDVVGLRRAEARGGRRLLELDSARCHIQLHRLHRRRRRSHQHGEQHQDQHKRPRQQVQPCFAFDQEMGAARARRLGPVPSRSLLHASPDRSPRTMMFSLDCDR